MKVKGTIAGLLCAALVLTPALASGGCPSCVDYALGYNGVSEALTSESVKPGKTPEAVPQVTALNGYEFKGWSLTDPSKLKEGELPELVDPTTVKIKEATTFYAVYGMGEHTTADHSHYVIGYPNGDFGPGDSINRASVATIIARACLDGFVEGADYGNPGDYADVEDHWAYSAISFCTMHDVFKGYGDGTFGPDQPITRQEFALVIARLSGLESGTPPFLDSADIASWAVDGVYTAYAKGWVNGYTDGTFLPLNDIRRDEAVKIFNGYLNRGVDEPGLAELPEGAYVEWPDVAEDHWAYYEIAEAANDHTFYYVDEAAAVPPEHWTSTPAMAEEG